MENGSRRSSTVYYQSLHFQLADPNCDLPPQRFSMKSSQRPKHPVHSAFAPPPLLPPREVCGMCKRDLGPHYVVCDACHTSYHNACVDPAAVRIHTLAHWYCERCVVQHCAPVLKFLTDLREVALLYDTDAGGVSTRTDDNDATVAARTDDTPDDATGVVVRTDEALGDTDSTAATVGSDDDGLSLSDIATDDLSTTTTLATSSSGVVDATSVSHDAPLPSLVAQIDALVAQLKSPMQRQSLLTSSTGELLVHVSHLDVAAVLKTVDTHLCDIAAAARERDDDDPSDDVKTSRGLYGILHVLNERHGITSARFHLKRTTTALQTLATKHVQACDAKLAKLIDAFAKERQVKRTWEEAVATAEADVAAQQTHVGQLNALIDSAVRQRKTLRAVSLAKRFIPTYRICTSELTESSDHLLMTIVADKLKGPTASLLEWEHMEEHFARAKMQLVAQKNGTTMPPPKKMKVEMEMPRPPSLKLVERQLKEVDKQVAAIQTQKAALRDTFALIQDTLASRLGDTLSNEWKALLATMDEMVRKCTPSIEQLKQDGEEEVSLEDDKSKDVVKEAVVEDGEMEHTTSSVDESNNADTDAAMTANEEDDVDVLVDRDGPEIVSLDDDDDDLLGAKNEPVLVATIDDD
ncbi:Aste57867_12692 [Aphanomyces stellatus]|uniref:Aste57867_12692 protein n=1 Tax=Aphanomyces stellatus TaxID=120398 RepID=A0A485KW90_9STRA|nr:hypothetical protein As57867_012645 [Aphanomyces stellatus]VFT89542.1 Aste57867_12692 [Aphanomyces stellatus]